MFFLVLSLLIIISNETIFEGAKNCPEGKVMRCFAAGPIKSKCYCYKKCPVGKELVCSAGRAFPFNDIFKKYCVCK